MTLTHIVVLLCTFLSPIEAAGAFTCYRQHDDFNTVDTNLDKASMNPYLTVEANNQEELKCRVSLSIHHLFGGRYEVVPQRLTTLDDNTIQLTVETVDNPDDIKMLQLMVLTPLSCKLSPKIVRLTSPGHYSVFSCVLEETVPSLIRPRRSQDGLRVTIATGNDRFAGSTARKYIELHGSKKNSDKFELDGGYEKKSSTTISPGDIGRIESIAISRDESGHDPSWQIDWVNIYEDDILVGNFECKCWIKSSRHKVLMNTVPICTAAGGGCGDNGACYQDKKCLCDNGYTGTYCDKPPCTADGGECGSWGQCYTNGSANRCECKQGYSGDLCTIPPCQPDVIPSRCKHGSCRDWGNGQTCSCSNGYTGHFCELAPCTTDGSECGDHGGCDYDFSMGIHSCVCTDNYNGTLCEEPPCVEGDSTCGLHGECEREGDTNQCVCRDGYSGTFCETAPCFLTFGLEHIDLCGVHGDCNDLGTGPMCYCVHGYTGHHCEQAPCSEGGGECGNHGDCNYDSCVCSDNYNGTVCDQPPCVEGDSTCGLHGECEREGDTNQCVCRDGYSGTFCETAPCEPGSFFIFTLDACQPHGECQDSGTGYMCHCQDRYTGPLCQTSADRCTTGGGECGENGVCVADDDGFRQCVCSNDYTGYLCDIPPCTQEGDECGDLGKCVIHGSVFACHCWDHYTGVHCSIPPCTADGEECGEHGYCDTNSTVSSVTNSSSAVCVCDEGFIGVHCEDAMVCTPNGGECQNGGVCKHEGDRPYCACQPTYSGPICNRKQQTTRSLAETVKVPLTSMLLSLSCLCTFARY